MFQAWAWFIVLGCGVLALGQAAHADPSDGEVGIFNHAGSLGDEDGLTPVFSPDEFNVYAKLVELDADQRIAALALYDAYKESVARFMQEQAETRQALSVLAARGDEEAKQNQETQPALARAERQKLEDGFWADFKNVLTPGQIEKSWARLEQQRRRDEYIDARGLALSGERVDLIKLVHGLGRELTSEMQSELAPVLRQYTEDFDHAVIERLKVKTWVRGKWPSFKKENDYKGMEDLYERGKAVAERVRGVNRRYVQQIEGVLPAELAAKFDLAFRKASFPALYEPEQAERVIEAVEKMDLSSDTVAVFRTIRQTFGRQQDQINKQLETAILTFEGGFNPVQQQEREAQGINGPAPGVKELFQIAAKREDLRKQTIGQVKAILTPEQIARLPGEDGAAPAKAKNEHRRPPNRQRSERGAGRGGQGVA